MKAQLIKFWQDEDGATAIEYGLIAGLIAAAIIATVALLGGQISQLFARITAALTDAGVAGGDGG